MARINYRPKGVCPVQISFDLDGDIVTNVQFTGGCNGNLKAICKVVNGWTVDQIEDMFKGNLCREKGTSCADQLACAVRAAYDGETD